MPNTGEDARPEIATPGPSAGDLIRENGRSVVLGLLTVAVAGAIFIAYHKARESRAEKAEGAFAAAQRNVYTGNAPLAQSDLRNVATRYEGTAAAAHAQLILAQLLFDEGKIPEGMAELDKLQKAGPPEDLRAAVEVLRASGYEEQQKFAEAAQSYLKAANASRFDPDKAKLKADAARAYTDAGNKVEARKLWEELAKDPKSPVAGEARVRLGELAAAANARG